MRKHRICAVLLIFICIGTLLSGCVVNKDHVVLKRENALKEYAAQEFDGYTFERYEEQEYEHDAYFTDDLCGFEFCVSSSAKSTSFDGCHAGYEEVTFDNWNYAYKKYLSDELYKQYPDLMNEQGFRYERDEFNAKNMSPSFGVNFAYVNTDRSFDETSGFLRELAAAITELDKHELCKQCEITAYSGENKFSDVLAIYRFKDDTVISSEEKEGYLMLDRASEQLGVQCTFVKYEMLRYSEIPNSSRMEALEGLAPDREIGVCFFTTPDGKEKFIADYKKNNEYYIDDVEENLWDD